VIQDHGETIVSKSNSKAVFLACDSDVVCTYDGFIRLERKEFPIEQELFCTTPLFGLPSMGSVVIMGIQLAYYMGFDSVYLYGIDHDFKVVADAKSDDPWRAAVNEGNHFIPNYRQGARWAPPATDLIEAGFLICKEKFASEAKSLINVSRRSKLPYVCRGDFDSLFGADGQVRAVGGAVLHHSATT
jgi:hypothetical protein